MGHSMFVLASGTTNRTNDAAHRRAEHLREAKVHRLALLHAGETPSETIQKLVLTLNGFNGTIDEERIFWQTRLEQASGTTILTYNGVDAARFLPHAIYSLDGRTKFTAFKNDESRPIPIDRLAEIIKGHPIVKEKQVLGNLRGALYFESGGDIWDFRQDGGKVYLTVGGRFIYVLTNDLEIQLRNGTTLARLKPNEHTNGSAVQYADPNEVAKQIFNYYFEHLLK